LRQQPASSIALAIAGLAARRTFRATGANPVAVRETVIDLRDLDLKTDGSDNFAP
jgi:hypothetical protein